MPKTHFGRVIKTCHQAALLASDWMQPHIDESMQLAEAVAKRSAPETIA